jgi:hypothetical protein
LQKAKAAAMLIVWSSRIISVFVAFVPGNVRLPTLKASETSAAQRASFAVAIPRPQIALKRLQLTPISRRYWDEPL